MTVRFQAVVLRFTPTAEQGVEDAYAFVDRHRDLWVGINMAGREDNEKGYPGRFLSVYRKMMGKYPAISLSIHAGESDEPIHHVRDTLFLGALRSGVMAYDRMRENEITVGLASDVAAGPELNPWEVMKAASYGQNVRSCYVRNAKTFSPAQLAVRRSSESNRRSANFEKASWPIALSGTRGAYSHTAQNCPTNHPNWCHY